MITPIFCLIVFCLTNYNTLSTQNHLEPILIATKAAFGIIRQGRPYGLHFRTAGLPRRNCRAGNKAERQARQYDTQ